MWAAPRIWDNEECYILGGGGSLPLQFGVPQDIINSVLGKYTPVSIYSDYITELHDKHVIAVNDSYKIGDWIDVLFFGDLGYWKRFSKEIVNFPGLIVTTASQIVIPGVKQMERDNKKRYGLSDDPRKLTWNFNSGAASINLAYLFGVKRIHLFGFDMCLTNNQQHWHSNYGSPVKQVHHNFNRHLIGFPAIAEHLKCKGVEVINYNPDSKITCFPRMNWNDRV